MKNIFIIIFVFSVLFLYGCTLENMTARVISDNAGENNDDELLSKAMDTKDVAYCREIIFSLKQEECLINLAKELNNPDICYFIEDDIIQESCLNWINKYKSIIK